jgi:hypothetical protein
MGSAAASGRLNHRRTREKRTFSPELAATACQQHTPAMQNRVSLKLGTNVEI